MIKAVLFDMIGTTVKTGKPDFIIDCFKKAFVEFNIVTDDEWLIKNRGKNKLTMIEDELAKHNQPAALAEKILAAFNREIHHSLHSFSEMDGAASVFNFLKEKEIQTGIGSGLSEEIFHIVFKHLGWNNYQFDYTGVSEKLGKSRPDPVMIYDMMNQLNIKSAGDVLKVGDTVADIQEGKNAGAITAVLLSGTQSEAMLRKENPDYILHSLHDLLNLRLWQ
jgi:HAD superfamily hydrolase (TIGR01549 family)